MSLEKGSLVEGTVTGIAKFGAFINLGEGRVGLVHISEIAQSYVTKIEEHLKVGDCVKVMVLGENKPGKYDLSIKRTVAEAPQQPTFQPRDGLEDKITKFLKQSEEKQFDLKRNLQWKQEGRKKRKPISKV